MKPKSRSTFGGNARIIRDSYSRKDIGQNWYDVRKRVSDRDGGMCQMKVNGRNCTNKGNDIHHIIPLSRGGTTTFSNLISVCHSCHAQRHSHL